MNFRNKSFKILGGLLIIGLLYMSTIHLMIKLAENEETISNADFLVVLGARLYGDYPSPALRERLDSALVYLNNNSSTRVIVTGGKGADELIPEALAMRDYLVAGGIDQSRIIMEDKSTSTFENLALTKELISSLGEVDPTIVIVSNKFHLFRARLLARRVGIEPGLLGAEIPPTIVLSSYLREYLAVAKSIIFDF